MTAPDTEQADVLDYAPIDEPGGAISVYEGDPGPVGAIACLTSAIFGDAAFSPDVEAELVDHALGLPSS